VIGAVVLAAGEASRFGSPKQRLFLPAVLERLAQTSVAQVVVVEGAHALDDVELGEATLVHCSEWGRGPGASLRCGLDALGGNVETAVVVLADGPNLDPRSVERLLERRGEAPLVAASYDGTRDHPVVLAHALWSSVPDEGARALDALLVDCSDLQAPGDVDLPAG
jgi:CTP:molybdopterin cytidylyltransferase MocA